MVSGSSLGGTLFFLLVISWSDDCYIPVSNTTGNRDSEKYMDIVLTTILSSENSSPFCQFLDGCYCSIMFPFCFQGLMAHFPIFSPNLNIAVLMFYFNTSGILFCLPELRLYILPGVLRSTPNKILWATEPSYSCNVS